MGRFWIDTDDLHEEVDHCESAWRRAIELHEKGHKRVTVIDKSWQAAPPAEKKAEKKVKGKK